MRAIIAVPIALVSYVFFVLLILIFCHWFFDKPKDWPYLIPIITATVSLAISSGIAEDALGSPAGARIAAMIIAAFWVIFVVVDVTNTIQDIIDLVTGNRIEEDPLEVLMYYTDNLLNAKIFAVVSCILALGHAE